MSHHDADLPDHQSNGPLEDEDGRLRRVEAFMGLIAQRLGIQVPGATAQPEQAAPAPLFPPPTKNLLHPNSPPMFDGDRAKGRAFLHAVRTYVNLRPEAFLVNGQHSDERVIRFAMSFMSEGAAHRWAQRQYQFNTFPFALWDEFVTEFSARFVEQNEAEHAVQKLEGTGYHMGKKDIWKYTDDFEDIYDLSGYTDSLLKVIKYRAGLTSEIDNAIATAANPPGDRDFRTWRLRAFKQYEAFSRRRGGSSSLFRPSAPAPVQAFRPRAFPVAVAPAAPMPTASSGVVPMELDQTRANTLARVRTCFQCGQPGHLANACKVALDVRSIDIVDDVIQQLDGDMLDELLSRAQDIRAAAEHARTIQEEDFLNRNE